MLFRQEVNGILPVIMDNFLQVLDPNYPNLSARTITPNWYMPNSIQFVETSDGKAVEAVMEIPGAKRESISITIDGNDIEVKFKDRFDREISHSAKIGSHLDREGTTSTYVDGVLTIRLPKTVPKDSLIKVPVTF